MLDKNNKVNLKYKLLLFMLGVGVGLFIWLINNQYYMYKYESQELQRTIEGYKRAYSSADEWTKNKTLDQLNELLNEIIGKKNRSLLIFPTDDYFSGKVVNNTIESIALKNNTNYSFDIYYKSNRDFYREYYCELILAGDLPAIEKSLRDIDRQYPLIKWREAHLDNNNSLVVKFTFFAFWDRKWNCYFIGNDFSYEKYLEYNLTKSENFKIKSWLFPFSLWVKNLQEEIVGFYKHELSLRELSPEVYKGKELFFNKREIDAYLYKTTAIMDLIKKWKEEDGMQLSDLLETCYQDIEQN